jgi:integrase
MPRAPRVPSLRRHKPSQQGVVTLDGNDQYLGRWPDGLRQPPPEVQAEYDRLIAEWLANGRRLPTPPEEQHRGISVNELILAFWKWAEVHYRHEDGEPTSELDNHRLSLRPLRKLYGALPAADFSPLKLKAVRQQMIEAGLCRTEINRRVGRIVRVFRWAVSEELVPESLYRSLATVRGLEKGRTEARESEPVEPVADEIVEQTLPHMSRTVRAMVQVQRLTGARPGEVCAMRACDIDRSGPVWLYNPKKHKTRHRGKRRVVAIGPKAQAIIRCWLRMTCPVCGLTDLPHRLGWRGELCGPCADRTDEAGMCGPWPKVEPAGDYNLFSPLEAVRVSREERRAKRKTRVPPSQQNRKKSRPKKQPGQRYLPASYACAIWRACEKAGIEHWHPHQIRHTHGTEVRKLFGLEAAQVALGHAQANVTEVYAERDLRLAIKVAEEIG